jgi:hypothetical protein
MADANRRVSSEVVLRQGSIGQVYVVKGMMRYGVICVSLPEMDLSHVVLEHLAPPVQSVCP